MTSEYDEGLKINRQRVTWKPTYLLSRASPGQIIATLSRRAATKQLVSKYAEMYTKYDITSVDYTVRKFNLTAALPKNLEINPNTHNVTLGEASIAILLEALLQRIDYIATRDTPELYKCDDDQVKAFEKFQNDILEFKKVVVSFSDPSSI